MQNAELPLRTPHSALRSPPAESAINYVAVYSLGRARRALSVTVEQVQKAIPRQTVLLELLRYSHYLGTNKWEPRYGVIVLASSAEPKWVPLGSAEAIEKNVARYQAAVRGGAVEERGGSERGERRGDETVSRRAGESVSGNSKSQIANRKSEPGFSTLLQALYQQLWAPIDAVLPKGTKTVIISPDGALIFLSYATLLTPDDQFLSQKYSLRYVSSGRDLLKEKKPSPNKRVAIYANPDFAGKGAAVSPGETTRTGVPFGVRTDSTPSLTNSGAGAGKEVRDAVERVLTDPGEEFARLRYLDRRDLQELRLEPLPGTAKESAALTAQAKKWNWATDVFVGAEASEVQLAAVESPRILHLATHGFFLPDVGEGESVGASERRGVGGVRPNFEPSPMGSFSGGGFEAGMIGGFTSACGIEEPNAPQRAGLGRSASDAGRLETR